jgi:hypothetical protein
MVDKMTRQKLYEIADSLSEHYDLDMVNKINGIAIFIFDQKSHGLAVYGYYLGMIDFNMLINAIIVEIKRKAVEDYLRGVDKWQL